MVCQEAPANGLPPIKVKHLILYLLIFIIVPAIIFYLGTWMDKCLDLPEFPPFPWNLVFGFLVFFSGLGLGIQSTRTLYSQGRGLPWGEIQEDAKSDRLVTCGPYGYTRNPMTLGYSLLPLGMGLMFRSPSMALVFTILVLAVEVPFLKLKEEPNLERRFGLQYLEYKRQTPFLVPDFRKLLRVSASMSRMVVASASKKSNCGPSIVEAGYLGISLLGLVLLPFLVFSPKVSKVTSDAHKQITVSVFICICLMGMIFALYPSRVSSKLHFKGSLRKTYPVSKEKEDKTAFEGHHPVCGAFDSHVLLLQGHKYCAGCSGLTVGAIISIAGALAYALSCPPEPVLLPSLWIGICFTSLGLLQYRLGVLSAYVHFIINVFFAVGPLLLLIGAAELTRSLSVQAYTLSMTIFWILARITFSGLHHIRICSVCFNPTCNHSWRQVDHRENFE